MKSTLKHLARLGIVTAAVLVGVLALQGSNAPAAHAATECYASNCNDKDPTTTVGPHNVTCSKNAYLQQTVYYKDNNGNQDAWIQNWWSQECNANWTVVNVNSGYEITFAEADACGGTKGNPNGGEPYCASSPEVSTCNDVSFSKYANCTYYHAYSIPSGATHWYTNMVQGNWPTYSYAHSTAPNASTMYTGWH